MTWFVKEIYLVLLDYQHLRQDQVSKESEADKQKKQASQYSDVAKAALKDGKTTLVGTIIPNSRGWVPVTKLVDGKFVKKAFNTKNGEFAEVAGAAGTE